eukprot:CAMPEP_0204474590 /NCGR_PEP_ID=MMETSP0471-20130131/26774_1 /ASSEMBLY_ACC=CAM_ASM_000602 /TAXON_ID=2969 /ORGANISM="Oxyrrhis marina" /LENGTH=81 /DNA_ID=CAMNT_0051476983 /DNA_START=402 /DNA_END=644 /DNA_ORIENTATION=-
MSINRLSSALDSGAQFEGYPPEAWGLAGVGLCSTDFGARHPASTSTAAPQIAIDKNNVSIRNSTQNTTARYQVSQGPKRPS